MAAVLAFPANPDEERKLIARLFELAVAGESDGEEFRELEARALRGMTRWCSKEHPTLPGTAHFWAG
jgi:hypothetical protein